jgi:arylsulfatase A
MLRLTCITTALLLFTTLASAAEPARPNIVVILCDDLGYGDLSCYGHPHIKTPNLDAMAKAGIRFTDFYSTAPVCSSSRVGLLTGRSPNRAGVYDWIPPSNSDRGRGQVHMRKTEITIPALLKSAGYATCMSGKWHCNAAFNSDRQPQPGDFGFDHWFATQNNAAPSHANPRNFIRNGKRVGPLAGYSCQLVAEEAGDWIEKHVKSSPKVPFYAHVCFHEPHEPVASPKELVAQYKDVAKNHKQAEYFANVANLDDATGKLLAKLDSLGLTDNTLVLFTSDNGPETLNRYGGAGRSYGTPGPLRGMKLWTSDAGFRVAGIAKWPDRIKPGQISRHPVSALDLLPTFCKLAGAKVPVTLNLDGAVCLSAFDGQPVKRTKPLIWAYYNAINQHRVAMRDGDGKILAKLNGGSLRKMTNISAGNVKQVWAAKLTDFELFDMATDIGERKNLAKENPKTLAELRGKLEKHYAELKSDSHVWK